MLSVVIDIFVFANNTNLFVIVLQSLFVRHSLDSYETERDTQQIP